jgi:hypothetical protein
VQGERVRREAAEKRARGGAERGRTRERREKAREEKSVQVCKYLFGEYSDHCTNLVSTSS